MSFPELHDRLTVFLNSLENLSPAGQRDSIVSEVIETGGIFNAPPVKDGSGCISAEISLHGVSGYGETEDEAIRNWKRAARYIANECAA